MEEQRDNCTNFQMVARWEASGQLEAAAASGVGKGRLIPFQQVIVDR